MTGESSAAAHGRQFAGQMASAVREQLLAEQTECTFIWQGRESAGGTIMSYFWHDDALWLTTNDSRPRVTAVRRTARATAVISSLGTSLGGSRCLTIMGTCAVLEDRVSKDWFFPRFCARLFPDNPRAQAAMQAMLDREGQVILRLQADRVIAYDGHALMAKLAAL